MATQILKKTRYPGAEPFGQHQKNVFKGRENDSQKLYDLVNRNHTTLLYAKSGLGKSSLINAGLLPLLEENKKDMEAISFRLSAYRGEESLLPVQNIIDRLPISEDFQSEWLDKITPNKSHLWYHIQRLCLANPEKNYLFILDQFEELFTYPQLAINQFKKQLADVLYKDAPNEVWKAYEKDESLLSDEELDLLEEKLPIKIIFAIREDRYSFLNDLTDALPSLTQSRYSLKPLSISQAKDAIILPAGEGKEGDFSSTAFTFTEEAVTEILQFLTKGGTQTVETTQLQILCNRLESLGLQEIKKNDIPDFDNIFLDFYRNTLAAVAEKEKKQAQIFVETELIRQGNRVSLDKRVCLEYVSERTLNTLVDKHLLRSERNTVGGFSYELAHDTLVEPILQAKEERENQEEEERAEAERLAEEKRLREQAEQDRLEKQKTQKQLRQTRLLLTGALIALVLAVVAGVFAWNQSRAAIEAKKEAEENATLAEQRADEAKKAQTEAEANLKDFYQAEITRLTRELETTKTNIESFDRLGASELMDFEKIKKDSLENKLKESETKLKELEK